MPNLFWAALLLLCSLLSPAAWATDPAAVSGVDGLIRTIFEPFANLIVPIVFAKIPGTEILWIVMWLGVASITCTVYFRFIQFRLFGLAIQAVRGRFSNKTDQGEVSHFQALTTALAATVGLGNIAGVAVAISLGGPGATFWMIMLGLFGMATKFAECTLGVKYRQINADGSVSGGPMYYLKAGLAERGFPRFGKFLGGAAALILAFAAFGIGNLFQVNQATSQLMSQFQITEGAYLFGIGFGVVCALVIVGGIKSIARVTSILVPFMVVLYLLAGVIILGMNLDKLPTAFAAILSGAFTPEAGFGGFVGALMQGLKRGAFSNEAGFGSAPIAHAAVKTNEPSTEGLVALLEPFIDTVVICTMTALVIIVTGAYLDKDVAGAVMTSNAFNSVLPGFDVVLTISIVLFAFSTMLSWSYYGLKGWTYLFGEKTALLYKLVFCAVSVIAAAMSLDAVIDLSDALVFILAFFNVLGLYFLLPIVRAEINGFLHKIKTGVIKPND